MSSELLQPTSHEHDPTWMGSPATRSTFDLVTSCVLTLLLCVWTAVHLNILSHKDRKSTIFGRFLAQFRERVLWVSVGLVGPEFTLHMAWIQFVLARWMMREIDKVEKSTPGNNTATTGSNAGPNLKTGSTVATAEEANPDIEAQRPQQAQPPSLGLWPRFQRYVFPPDLELGFYAVMGGFEVVIKNEASEEPGDETDDKLRKTDDEFRETDDKFRKTDDKFRKTDDEFRKTLTPFGVVLLDTLGMFKKPDIDEIKDKSKTNMLSKVLACVQALWVVVQAIGRKLDGLPVTLLELNTIMHVASVLPMYVLWFYKPQDVGKPTEIAIPGNLEGRVVSLLLRATKIGEKRPKAKGFRERAKNIRHSVTALNPCLIYDRSTRAFIYRTDKGELRPIWNNNNETSTKTTSPHGGNNDPGTDASTVDGNNEISGIITIDADNEINNLETDPNAHGETKSPHTDARASVAGTGDDSVKVSSISISREDGSTIVISFSGSRVTDLRSVTPLDFTADDREIRLPRLTQQQARFLTNYVCNDDGNGLVRKVKFEAIMEKFKAAGSEDYARNLDKDHVEHFRALGLWWAFMVPLVAFSIIYGGIHLLTWNGHFPTHLERYIWRVSCLEIMVGIPVFNFIKEFFGLFYKQRAPWAKNVFMIVGIVILGQYMLARIFIFLEAFASLRNLPVGSYKTVTWTEKWPHF